MEVPNQLDTTVQTGSSQAATKVKICPKCGMERLPTTKVCPADGTILRDSEPTADNPLSTLSEKYEFIGETGRGGMAVIYKAKDRKTGRLVAIKKMLASSLTETAFLRFQQEAKAITSLRHPNIIMVHEFGVAEDGEPFMVMDFIEGSNLGDLIKSKGPLTVDLQGSFLSDDKLSQIKNMVWLQSLDIRGTAVTDSGMQHLSNLRDLRFLRAGELGVGDAAIVPLLNLQRLFELDLNATRITDKGVVKLAGIKSLKLLNLASTRVGDVGVAALATLPNLEKLDLDGTDITDEGLQHLKICKSLKELRISSCPRLSRAAVEKFDKEFNHLDEQEKVLADSESDSDVEKKLHVDVKSNSRPW